VPTVPIYEYRCNECGFQDEFLQKLSDPLLTKCPSCGKESLKKLLSAAGFQLKGSGWYATDFKGSGAKPAAKSGEEAKGDTSASDKPAGKGESAPAKTASEGAGSEKSAPKAESSGTPG
jgi:putative FmdB family regulatory protein